MNKWLTPLRRMVRRCGWDVVRYNWQTNINLRRSLFLQRLGITCVLDIGANAGDYVETLRRFGYGGEVISVEPTGGAFTVLEARSRRDPLWSARHLAVAGSAGPRTLNIASNSVSSSLLERSAALVAAAPESRYIARETVEATTLDALAAEARAALRPVWAKLDVQGSAAEILDVSGQALSQISALEIEMPFVPMYEGEGLFAGIAGNLQQRGFELASLEANTFDRRRGAVLEVNAICVRQGAWGHAK
jgi:FkbM family methyltransferase